MSHAQYPSLSRSIPVLFSTQSYFRPQSIPHCPSPLIFALLIGSNDKSIPAHQSIKTICKNLNDHDLYQFKRSKSTVDWPFVKNQLFRNICAVFDCTTIRNLS